MKREASIHLRLCDAAKRELSALAQLEQVTEAELAARLLEEALLGRGHTFRVVARRYSRWLLDGNVGDSQG